MAGSGRGDQGDLTDPGIGAVLREALGQPRMRRGLSLGRLVRSWEHVVGPELARETAPVALEGGALVVAASTAAWGAQVRFLAKDVARRANETLDAEEVRTVRVTVSQEVRKPLRRNDSRP
jgi:predicted nucleic acid-binding Zn ribbon protein